MFHSYIKNQQEGYITFMSILIVSVVGIAVAVSLISLGLGISRTSFALEQSNQTKGITNACVEEALQEIRNSTQFTGSGNLTLTQGACSYTVTSQGGQNRTITASGTVNNITRRVEVIIDQINPTIQVVSWQEVDSF